MVRGPYGEPVPLVLPRTLIGAEILRCDRNMSTDVNVDFLTNARPVERARVWTSINIFASLSAAIACLLIVAAPDLPLSALTVDVAQTLSTEALVIGFCALMSMINAYSSYQMIRALSNSTQDF
jgi:hypothetical protein